MISMTVTRHKQFSTDASSKIVQVVISFKLMCISNVKLVKTYFNISKQTEYGKGSRVKTSLNDFFY